MEYFYTSGGNNKPDFIYQLKVEEVTSEMFHWAKEYPPSRDCFQCFHVKYNVADNGKHDVIQFQWRDAYIAFKWAFAGEILQDITMKEYRYC
jgi:hypothetical protein